MISHLFSPSPSKVGWLCYVILRFILRSVYAVTTLFILAIALTLLYFDLRIAKNNFEIQMRHLRMAMFVGPVK